MRVDTRKVGNDAEDAAVRHLLGKGFAVRDRNVSCRYGELDIVAERGELLCFVEVRMREHDAFGDPMQTVMSSKQNRVVKAAMHYLQTQRLERDVRFDVISVVGRGPSARVEHVENAFDAGF
jgi:putative endonuclease